MPISCTPIRLFTILLATGTKAFSLSELITTNVSHSVGKNVAQQNPAALPPFPIMQIGLDHILGQMGENATAAENATIAQGLSSTPGSRRDFSRYSALNERGTPAQCSQDSPCVDGSCCNSEGKCGFTPYNCNSTASTTCLSNCDATAMCGIDSFDGEQKCPLNICCSYFGYCGTSSVFCQAADAAGTVTTPCQAGFGDCEVAPPPYCGPYSASASNGRKVAYFQASNLRYRLCNLVQPSQINTNGLTHLNFAFAGIDPISFAIHPADPSDVILYPQFTALKTPQLQTWISIGGFDFSALGPTFSTWTEMCASEQNRAAFITSLVDFMNLWGFQGVDIDWEYPTIAARGGQPDDTANFVSLLREMRTAFGNGYGISIALPPDFVYLAGFDPSGMEPFVDFYNYMAYDLHGPWEASTLGAFVRPQTSIFDINATMQPLWFDSVNPAKINLGIAYYGRGFTLSSMSCTDIGCPYTGPSAPGPCTNSTGILSLQEIDQIVNEKHITPQLLPDLMIKQIVWDSNQWMGYDDNDTVALKTTWADENCLGGIAIWSIDLVSGLGSDEAPLITTTNAQCGSNGMTCLGGQFGDCCSNDGWCGSTPAYCSPNNCQASFGTCEADSTVLAVSINGVCGNGVTCQGSVFGNCCSRYGFCGSTAPYCTTGCQSLFGSCGLAAELPVSKYGSCGNGVTCDGSVFGNCCSKYGYCGNSIDYCGNGCQEAYGTCQ